MFERAGKTLRLDWARNRGRSLSVRSSNFRCPKNSDEITFEIFRGRQRRAFLGFSSGAADRQETAQGTPFGDERLENSGVGPSIFVRNRSNVLERFEFRTDRFSLD